MKLQQLDYILPSNAVAHTPASPRDHAKLLLVDRKTNEFKHKHFYDLSNILTNNDVLVFNKTKVFPARLFGNKETGGRVEILLLEEVSQNTWTALSKGKLAEGQKILFQGATATVINKLEGSIEVEFQVENFWEWIDLNGHVPLPPYIQSNLTEKNLRSEYQTVFAQTNGSVAAPTAGLHFTEKLISDLLKKGVSIEYVTLHVGAGTFLPIKTEDLSKHIMHTEHFILENSTAQKLNIYKQEGKRIISVGTTTTRVLETCSDNEGVLKPQSGSTDIFIYPPYKFKFVDALITNFHLPHSTLLALVSAFVSTPNTIESFKDFKSSLMGKAYAHAIENNYRFYSFGDGMFIV